jgi:hypothetical protein
MKKIVLVLIATLFVGILANSQEKQKQKKDLPTKASQIPIVDSSSKNVNQSGNPSAEVVKFKIEPEIQEALLNKLKDKENKWWEWPATLIAILLSGLGFFLAWRSFKVDRSYRRLAFLSETDKMQVDHPDVSAFDDERMKVLKSSIEIKAPTVINITGREKIFVKHPYTIKITALLIPVKVEKNGQSCPDIISQKTEEFIETSSSDEFIVENAAKIEIVQSNGLILQSYADKLLEARIQAFCYYKLNNFELALKGLEKSDKSPWEEYLKRTNTKSTVFANIVKNAQTTKRDIFGKKFLETLDRIFPENLPPKP